MENEIGFDNKKQSKRKGSDCTLMAERPLSNPNSKVFVEQNYIKSVLNEFIKDRIKS